jgi:RluA family pseudouridine synthase
MTPPLFTQCPILFEDSWLIVVNKPKGTLSHPNKVGDETHSAFLGPYDDEAKCFQTPAGKLWLIHRLDQDTSGVLLAAKDSASADQCRAAFAEHTVRKTYRALCAGGGLKAQGSWQDHLAIKHERKQVRCTVVPGARPNAESHYRLLGYDPKQRLSWIEVDLITGKTHQIRVQTASRRLPIVGDDIYGDFTLNRRLKKEIQARHLCLHAARLSLPHPKTKEVIEITAPLDASMQRVLTTVGLG